jgi:nitrogen fixation NifU-like protein
MDEALNRFIEELKIQISSEMKAAYGDGAFYRWMNPTYMGSMEKADAHGSLANVCGDVMEIFLRIEAGRVTEARFRTNGCGATLACGSFAAEVALGRTVNELLDIKGEVILERMGGLPEQERHCAYLAAEALKKASMDYMGRMSKRGHGTGDVDHRPHGSM